MTIEGQIAKPLSAVKMLAITAGARITEPHLSPNALSAGTLAMMPASFPGSPGGINS